MITEKLIYVTKDGTEFGTKIDAQNHQNAAAFANNIADDLGVYSKIEDIDELVNWLLEKTFISLADLEERYGE